jgi:hypothetical protein
MPAETLIYKGYLSSNERGPREHSKLTNEYIKEPMSHVEWVILSLVTKKVSGDSV